MTTTSTAFLRLEHTFADLEGLSVPWTGATAPDPNLVVLNESLATELDLDPTALRQPETVAVLAGSVPPPGSTTVAMAYAGHQFGNYSPLLGDGRALLLGELVGPDGVRRDIHLKGSGATPFSRGGDGKAVLGPMLREYLISEAMHALGIATTRSLAVVTTGEGVQRDDVEPGAVNVRIAEGHVRVGTFEFAVRRYDPQTGQGPLRPLAEYVIARHYPELAGAPNRFLALFEAVVARQAERVAQWMAVGFVHGVMNTDNTTITGETIDYGPCAFMDTYHPGTVFSSIDASGRYAYGNQPAVLGWNLARFGESLIPLVDDDVDSAVTAITAVLDTYGRQYEQHFESAMAAKLGLTALPERGLLDDLLVLLRDNTVDWTGFFRALADELRSNPAPLDGLVDRAVIGGWLERWRPSVTATADEMDRVNPIYIPRNHIVDEALRAATAGDLTPVRELIDVLTDPFTRRDGLERYALPAPPELGRFRTYCGT